MEIKKLAIIINPVSGRGCNVLDTFNEVFTKEGVDWDVFVTKKPGDAKKYSLDAVTKNYDAVAVYGGDGTVSEVASVLVNSNTPLAIIPGGTANVFATELKIPYLLKDACKLIISKKSFIKKVDVGKLNDTNFILRVGIGFEALMIQKANKFLKRKIGIMAYFISAFLATVETRNSLYKITADEKYFEYRGISCLIANSSNMGLPKFNIVGNGKIDDGVFDVIILKNVNFIKLFISLVKDPLNFLEHLSPIKHFQAKRLCINLEQVQKIQVDGEILLTDKLDIQIIPNSLQVVVR